MEDASTLTGIGTSPTLEDTDGDGWTDYEEFDNPSISPDFSDDPFNYR